MGRGVKDSDHDQGRGGGGQDLHQCCSCGLDCGTTTDLYRHVAVRCRELGESMEMFRSKHRLKCDQLRYLRQQEEAGQGGHQPSHHCKARGAATILLLLVLS